MSTKRQLRLEHYKKFRSEVERRGWVLISLSKEYVNQQNPVTVICPNGHKIKLTPDSFLGRAKPKAIALIHPIGSGCAICSGRRKSIVDLQLMAKKYNGECLTDKYYGANFKYSWKCDKGHLWNARLSGPQYGHWCPYCNGKLLVDGLKELKQLAKKRGGKSLAKKFLKSQSKYAWICSKGHHFKASHNSVKRGTWCSKCLGRYRTITDMQKEAKKKGGKCLSDKYIHSFSPLEWECSKGHRWFACPVSIFQGSWCPDCGGSKKLTLEQMQEYAHKRKGKCLSKKYINAKSKLEWQCQEGHRWFSVSYIVKAGMWCPTCGHVRFTIQDLKNYAKEQDGSCLTANYEHSKTKYSWACKHGHEWKATFKEARSNWCLECRRLK